MEKVLGNEKIKRLVVSLKSSKKWRLMDPIEIAESLKILCGSFSRKEVARRLGISEKGTLWVYLRLLGLSEHVKELIRDGKVGQDAGYRISLLDSPREQDLLAEAVVSHHLVSSELKAIVQNIKKRNRELPIEKCIGLTLKARHRVTEEHIIVAKIEPSTLGLLKQNSREQGVAVEELLNIALSKLLSLQKIKSLKLVNATVIMSLGKDDYRLLVNKAREFKVTMENLVDTLVKRGLVT